LRSQGAFTALASSRFGPSGGFVSQMIHELLDSLTAKLHARAVKVACQFYRRTN
jgi:hypothetical protein